MRNHYFLLPLLAVLLTGCGQDETDTPAPAASEPAPPASTSVPTAPAAAPEATQPAAPPAAPPAAVAPAPDPAPEPVAANNAGTEVTPAADAEPAPAREPTQHIVKGVVTQWRPMILFIEPGDSVTFRQMTGHDTETMEGLIPTGAATWRSKMGAEGFTVSPTVPGAYIYKCNPHMSSGMIGAIVVGERPPANLAELEASPQNKGMTGRAIRKLKQALEVAP